jgi:hypothetical protein
MRERTPAGTTYAVSPAVVIVVVAAGDALTDVSPVVAWTPPRTTNADSAVKARRLKVPRGCLGFVRVRDLIGTYDKVVSKAC